jgi:hypothetical protein
MISQPNYSKLTTGDGNPKELTPAQRMAWNAYVDFLEKKGYKGSPDLDKKETGLAKSLFEQFKQTNPTSPLNYDDIKSVQMEMQRLKDTAQGFAARHGDKNAKNVMVGVSPIDGWPGSKTTSFKFPAMTEQQFHDNNLVKQQNLGLVDSNLRPSGIGMMSRQIPKGINLETFYDSTGKQTGKGYTDPKSGDIIMVNQ